MLRSRSRRLSWRQEWMSLTASWNSLFQTGQVVRATPWVSSRLLSSSTTQCRLAGLLDTPAIVISIITIIKVKM